MRFFLFPALLLSLCLSLLPVRAETGDVAATEPGDSAPIAPQAAHPLDELYLALKAERSEPPARRIASRINKELAKKGGATADLLIEWATKAIKEKNYTVANDLLDQVIVLYPDYAEGWNNRALMHLAAGNYAMAISDLSQALTIEPRHFGALSGLAGILRMTGKEEVALDVYRRLLEIYPQHRAAQRAVMQITEGLTDEAM